MRKSKQRTQIEKSALSSSKLQLSSVGFSSWISSLQTQHYVGQGADLTSQNQSSQPVLVHMLGHPSPSLPPSARLSAWRESFQVNGGGESGVSLILSMEKLCSLTCDSIQVRLCLLKCPGSSLACRRGEEQFQKVRGISSCHFSSCEGHTALSACNFHPELTTVLNAGGPPF